MKKIFHIFLNMVPVLIMIGLIPIVPSDYSLTLIYCVLIIIFLLIKRKRNDIFVFFFGFFAMILFEYVFVKTGVETFQRNGFLGIMPLWLPFLWGYGFIAIKRSVRILSRYK